MWDMRASVNDRACAVPRWKPVLCLTSGPIMRKRTRGRLGPTTTNRRCAYVSPRTESLTDSPPSGLSAKLTDETHRIPQVEDYFNYMGMLASDGNYDRLNEYTNAGLDCVDLLLLMASSEGDTPKVEELLEAGANVNVSSDKVYGGKTAIELCTKEEIKEMLQAKV